MGNWKQNPMVAISSALLVLVVALVAVTMGGKKVAYSLKCESCNTEFQVKLPVDTKFPIVCPACGKSTAYPLIKMKCKACGKIFERLNKPIAVGTGAIDVSNAAKPQRGADPTSRCPHCGVQGQFDVVK
jgi:DNA-directed RNA polymerase subunit RPC12/RpoP